MATSAANTKFKVENGLDVIGSANVSSNLRVEGDLTVVGTFASTLNINDNIYPYSNHVYSLGSTTKRWTLYGSSADFSNTVQISNTANISAITANSIIPNANSQPLGSSTLRWSISANTIQLLEANSSSYFQVSAAEATFNASTGVNGATDLITCSGPHSFTNGELIQYIVAPGNTAIGGLSNGSYYYATYRGSTTLTLSTTYGGANIDITGGSSETGHSLIPVKAYIGTGGIRMPLLSANVGSLRVFGNAIVNGDLTVVGNASFDTDLLYLDATNNRVGFKNSSPSSAAVVTVTGNVEFSIANTGLRLNTGTASINGYIMMVANSSNSRLTFSTYDNSTSGTQDGGYEFLGVNSTATQTLLSFNNYQMLYKSGNVASKSNFGIYNVSGTRVGP